MNQDDLLNTLKSNPFVLAPMAGITDCAFRSFMKSMGTSVVVTELVSANGLKYSSERTKVLMRFTEDQRPVGIQFFGEDLNHLSDAALMAQDMGADFVDLNFGCPVPKVVSKGAGSALLKDLVQLRKVIQATKKQIQIPLTIKVRTGWDENHRNAVEVCQIAFDEGVTWVAIHGRTRSKGYTGLADWDYIRDVKSRSKVPVIGNGDIVTPEMANQRLSESGCDAVMIGRGCLKNPWIFKEAMELRNYSLVASNGYSIEDLNKSLTKNLIKNTNKNLLIDLNQNLNENLTKDVIKNSNRDHGLVLEILFEKLNTLSDERIIGLQVKKFATWFSAGYPDSSQFRKEVFQIKDKYEIYEFAKKYFASFKGINQKDTSDEAFLMGGHG